MKLRKTRRGFTIVELVIVVAVIGVLAAVLIPTFINLTNKANKASDNSLVANLNTALAGREGEADDTPNYSMHDAIDDLEIWGYKFENLTTKANQHLLWNVKTNRFCLEDNADLVNYKAEDYWKIVKNTSEMGDYSGYAHTKFNQSEVEVTAGFDAGDVTTITKITYNRSTATSSKSVVLRGNSNKTTLNVDAPLDHVRKEGEFGLIEKEITAKNSFVDNGTTGYVNLSGGRFVFTENTKVDFLFLNIDLNDADKALYITYEAGATKLTAEQLGKPQLGTALGDSLVRLVEVEDESTGTTETIYAKGGSTFEENEIYVSTNGGTPVSVSADTASETAKAVANAYVEGTGAVETGLSEDEVADVMDEVASEAVSADFAEDEDHSNYVARINQTGYEKLSTAINAAVNGKTVVLLQDVEFEGISGSARLFITKNITLDGNGHSVRAHGRGFGIGTQKVTFKDITISNPDSGARCIDTRGGTSGYPAVEELTLTNVILSTPGTGSALQPLTIGGNQSTKVKINIENSILQTNDKGNSGYTIISFNPVDMTIRNSEIYGWSAIYLKGPDSSAGSAGSTVKIYDSKLYSMNKYSGSSDNFGTIVFEDDHIDLLLSNCELYANTSYVSQSLVVFSDYNGSICTDSTVVIEGEGTVTYGTLATRSPNGGANCSLVIRGGTFNVDPTNYVAEGHTVVENADGTWTVK